jgi:hypothetical protein
MFYLSESNDIKIRFVKWYHITPHTLYTYFLNLAVIMSTVVLALDSPFDEPDDFKHQSILVIDNILTVIFLVEAMIKIAAMGFCKSSRTGNNKKAYLEDPWNVLDFMLVIVSGVDNIIKILGAKGLAMTRSVQGAKALRTLRSLRPLRMISKFKGLRIAINAIFSSLM